MAEPFVTSLRRHAKELQGLTDDHAREFLRMLEGMRSALRGRLAALAPTDASFDAFKLRMALAESETGIRVLAARGLRLYEGASTEAAELSLEHLTADIARMSKAFDGVRLDVNIEAAKVLTQPGRQLLAEQFQTSLARYGGELLNGVRQKMLLGMRVGDTFGNIVQAVSSEQGPLGQVGKANAERLIRTETNEAYNEANATGLREASKQIPGGLKKTWLHIGSYPCKTCGPLHGTTRPLDGTWTIKSGRKTFEVAHPPGHPGCVCRLAAMKDKWRGALEKLGYLDQDPEQDKTAAL